MASLIEIFFRPGTVFLRLRKERMWMTPLVANTVLAAGTVVLVVLLAGMELITLQRYQRDSRIAEKVGDAGIDANVNSSNTRAAKLLLISRSTGIVILMLLGLGMVAKIASKLIAPESSPPFPVFLAMAGYACFPFFLLRFVGTGIALVANPDHSSLNLDNVVTLNLAQLMDPGDTSRVIYDLAGSLDLVNVAQMLFLAFGFAKVIRISYSRSVMICAGLWFVFILWKAALSAFI